MALDRSCIRLIFFLFLQEKIWASNDKTYKDTFLTSKDSDQPVYLPSMATVLVYPSLDSVETIKGTCNQHPQSMFWAEIWKISAFLSENFQFLMVKFSIYLNRHVFIMIWVPWRLRSACASACLISLYWALWIANDSRFTFGLNIFISKLQWLYKHTWHIHKR